MKYSNKDKKNRTEKLFNDKNYAFKYNNEEVEEDLRPASVDRPICWWMKYK